MEQEEDQSQGEVSSRKEDGNWSASKEEEKTEPATEERLQSNEDRSNAKEAKEVRATEEKLGDAGSLSWLLGLGLSLLPSNHLDLSPRWQQWFLRCLTFSVCKEEEYYFYHRGQSGLLLMSCFYTIVCMGPIGLYLLTNIVQVRKNWSFMVVFVCLWLSIAVYDCL
mgnify:CR=1 FL=1